MKDNLRFAMAVYGGLSLFVLIIMAAGLIYAIMTYDDGMVRADAAASTAGFAVMFQLLVSKMGEVLRAMNGQKIEDQPNGGTNEQV